MTQPPSNASTYVEMRRGIQDSTRVVLKRALGGDEEVETKRSGVEKGFEEGLGGQLK